jgi:hypothetical protein
VGEDEVELGHLGDVQSHVLGELLADGLGLALRAVHGLSVLVGGGDGAATQLVVDQEADAAEAGQVVGAGDDDGAAAVGDVV